MANDSVVLVDTNDKEIGIADKNDAHLCPGMLHRAVSVLLYRIGDTGKELLICRRSDKKERWPLFWSNPVCTHPKPSESYVSCCTRRLSEELGIRMKKKSLQFLFRFSYDAPYDEVYCEHELDSVFIGMRIGKLRPDKDEVSEVRWLTYEALQADMAGHPQIYTPWFHKIMKRKEVVDFLAAQNSSV